MRKFLFTTIIFLFLFGSLQTVLAQTPTPTPAPLEQIQNVQYDLPYPGILPDNPLYILKALRDNVIGFFITDPVKKADYDLLMSDKRLGASQMLLEKGESDLSITTLGKAGNYFYLALQQAAIAKRQGENADPIISRLITASEKHQEVIYQMEQTVNGQVKYDLSLLLTREKGFQSTAESLQQQ